MATPRDAVSVPIMENFMGDIGDGCSLAVLLSFYCPQIVKLEGIMFIGFLKFFLTLSPLLATFVVVC